MNTLTINQKSTTVQSTTVTLPYYAMINEGPFAEYFAIIGSIGNLKVNLFKDFSSEDVRSALITTVSADLLPVAHQQISESAFAQAYEKATDVLNNVYFNACPATQDLAPAA